MEGCGIGMEQRWLGEVDGLRLLLMSDRAGFEWISVHEATTSPKF